MKEIETTIEAAATDLAAEIKKNLVEAPNVPVRRRTVRVVKLSKVELIDGLIDDLETKIFMTPEGDDPLSDKVVKRYQKQILKLRNKQSSLAHVKQPRKRHKSGGGA